MTQPKRIGSVIFFVIFLLMVTPSHQVDRSKFKTCEQSGFCKRNRQLWSTEGQSPYSLLADSISLLNSSYFEADIINLIDNVQLRLSISFETESAEFRIKEKEPFNNLRRYSVPEIPHFSSSSSRRKLSSSSSSVVAELKKSETEVQLITKTKIITDDEDENEEEEDNEEVTTTFRLNFSPFEVRVLFNDELEIELNTRGLLNFEHFRAKVVEEAKEEQVEGEEQQVEEKKVDEVKVEDGNYKKVGEHSLWEESFSSHHDSKPYGPTSVALDVKFVGSQYVYGIPEHASSFNLQSTRNGNEIKSDPYRLYNLDVFEYELNEVMALYGSVPLLVSRSPKRTTAFFWVNAAETWIDISRDDSGTATHWISESGELRFVLFYGSSSSSTNNNNNNNNNNTEEKKEKLERRTKKKKKRSGAVRRQYSERSGHGVLPPLFALGYHQCRWNYKDEADLLGVDALFDDSDLPLDVLWLDIEHTDGKRYFTWDSAAFPKPKEMTEEQLWLGKGRRLVTIVDPHLRRDGSYVVHAEAESHGYYVKKSDHKSDYDGWCWPGSSSWPDFTSAEVRQWWGDLFALDKYPGSSHSLHIWNDMNEPSVFNGPEVTMQKDLLHLDGTEHRDVHNIYGLYVHKATYDGLLKRSPNQRPFVLSRAFFAGSQKYGAVWTGDNAAQWSHLKASVPMLLSLSIAGITFSGADVGGFFGNPEAELMVRWYQVGTFYPFFRGHAHLDTKRREPYLYSEPHLSLLRTALRRRYSLLPYLYTVFWRDSLSGQGVLRALWEETFDDEEEEAELALGGVEDQFLLGSSILVKPVTEPALSSLSVLLPGKQGWYGLFDYKYYRDSLSLKTSLETVPAFLRAGTILPKKERARRSTTQMFKDPYTLVVALDPTGKARGELYIDDGVSFDYQKGDYQVVDFAFENLELTSSLRTKYEVQNLIERIVVLGLDFEPKMITVSFQDTQQHQLEFVYQREEKILTIRQPAPVGQWSLKIIP